MQGWRRTNQRGVKGRCQIGCLRRHIGDDQLLFDRRLLNVYVRIPNPHIGIMKVYPSRQNSKQRYLK
jgi:hypothetical protein